MKSKQKLKLKKNGHPISGNGESGNKVVELKLKKNDPAKKAYSLPIPHNPPASRDLHRYGQGRKAH
jgi:hypothetical protein